MVQSPGIVHVRDGHKGHGQESDGRITPERGHRVMIETEGIVHLLDVAQLQENDAEIGHEKEDQRTDHEREDAVGLEIDRVKEDAVDLGTGNRDTIADHLDDNIFLI